MLVAKAHDFMNKLTNGTANSIGELATQLNMNASNLSSTLRFAFLAPQIVESILNGSQPADLTAEKLRRLPNLPNSWNEQKELLGFAD